MARDIENVNITLPGESDTIELIVNGEPTEVVIALDSWASAVHADDADTVSGHTVARNVLADEYTNAQIDSMVETAGTVKTVNEVQPDQSGNVQITKTDIGLGNVDNTSDANKPISTATQAALDLKVDKVSGKGLSTNDYTDADKTKLDGIAAGAEVNVQADWNQTDSSADDYIKNKPSVTGAVWGSVTGTLSDQSDLKNALDAKQDAEQGKGLSEENYTSAEKTKLSGIETGAQANVQSDWNESDSSSDAFIQNKPTIPAKVSDLQNDSGFITGVSWGNIGGTLADQADLNNELTALNTGLSSAVKSVNDIIPDSNGNAEISASDIPANGMGERTTSGNPIEIEDGVVGNALDLSVDLEPIQDLHGYDHPWPAGGGANQWDEEWELGEYDESGQPAVNNTKIRSKNYIPIGEGYSYYYIVISNIIWLCFYDANHTFISGQTVSQSSSIAIPANAKYFRFNAASSYGTTYNHDIAINYPLTVTTYSPYSNICPISGYDSVSVQRIGHNVWDEEWESGRLNSDDGAKVTDANYIRSKNYIAVLPNATYYIKHSCDGTSRIAFYDKNKMYLGVSDGWKVFTKDSTITTPDNAYYALFYIQETSYNNDISINYPATVTSYEPYAGQSVTVQLGQTVYGGTVDVISGKVSVIYVVYRIGDLTWTMAGSNNPHFRATSPVTASSEREKVLSSCYRTVSSLTDNTTDNFAVYVTNVTSGNIRVRDNRFSDAGSFKTAMADETISFIIADPIELSVIPAQLSLLEGYNILTTDGDTINLRYIGSEASDVQAEIDEFENVTYKLTTSIAPIEQTTAIATHAVGDYIMLNGEFCKVISAIAVGETITIGTNVSRTTIADELKAIIAQLGA